MRLPKRQPKWTQWDPDHPSLRAPNPPYERSGVRRMHQAGIPAVRISFMLGWSGTMKLHNAMNRGIAEEYDAKKRGAKMHPPLPEGVR